MRKFQTAVYPPRMAPIGLKLGQNAFQTIPDVSFFDVKKVFVKHFSKNFVDWPMISSFWKSWSILSVTIEFSLKNDPDLPKVQVSTFLGEGVEGRLKFFFVDFGQKLTYSFCSMDHMMKWWSDNMMIWWFDDMMIMIIFDQKKIYKSWHGAFVFTTWNWRVQNRHGHVHDGVHAPRPNWISIKKSRVIILKFLDF